MIMTESEIRASYNSAADKDKQLEVLADLNVCTVRDIIKVIQGTPQEAKRQRYDKAAIAKCIEAGKGILETATLLGYNTTTSGFKQTYWKIKKSLELYRDSSSNTSKDSTVESIVAGLDEQVDEGDSGVVGSTSEVSVEEKHIASLTEGMMPLTSARNETVATKPVAIAKKVIPKGVNLGLVNSNPQINMGDKKSSVEIKSIEVKTSKKTGSSELLSKDESKTMKKVDSNESLRTGLKEALRSNIKQSEKKIAEKEDKIVEISNSKVEHGIENNDTESKSKDRVVDKENKVVESLHIKEDVSKDVDSTSEVQSIKKSISTEVGVSSVLPEVSESDTEKSGTSASSKLLNLYQEEIRIKLADIECELEALKLKHSSLIHARSVYLALLNDRG